MSSHLPGIIEHEDHSRGVGESRQVSRREEAGRLETPPAIRRPESGRHSQVRQQRVVLPVLERPLRALVATASCVRCQ